MNGFHGADVTCYKLLAGIRFPPFKTGIIIMEGKKKRKKDVERGRERGKCDVPVVNYAVVTPFWW